MVKAFLMSRPKLVECHVMVMHQYIHVNLNRCIFNSAKALMRINNSVSGFLGDWFIRNAMWSSCSGIKSNAANFKKFYAYLLAVNVIEQKDYNVLCSTIKEELPEWLGAMWRYDEMLYDEDCF